MTSFTASDPTRVVVVVGNPKAASRTLAAAESLAAAIADSVSHAELHVIDLATLAGQLLPTPSDVVRAELDAVAHAHVLVVATPVYKASFTGLLKVFLDYLPGNALNTALAVPVTVAASPAHRHVAESAVRPLLNELGARTTAGLGIDEGQLPDVDEPVARWLTTEGPLLRSVVAA
jgi:FMN reductase